MNFRNGMNYSGKFVSTRDVMAAADLFQEINNFPSQPACRTFPNYEFFQQFCKFVLTITIKAGK